jgi:transcriptional regulator of acetoin/glycerol metabolism
VCRGGLIELHHLPPELRPAGSAAQEALNPMNLQAMEKLLIADTLRRCNGNRKRTARTLGIDASTLYRKIQAFRIAVPDTDGRRRGKPS